MARLRQPAIDPVRPETVYAVVEAERSVMLRSDDGAAWTPVTGHGHTAMTAVSGGTRRSTTSREMTSSLRSGTDGTWYMICSISSSRMRPLGTARMSLLSIMGDWIARMVRSGKIFVIALRLNSL